MSGKSEVIKDFTIKVKEFRFDEKSKGRSLRLETSLKALSKFKDFSFLCPWSEDAFDFLNGLCDSLKISFASNLSLEILSRISESHETLRIFMRDRFSEIQSFLIENLIESSHSALELLRKLLYGINIHRLSSSTLSKLLSFLSKNVLESKVEALSSSLSILISLLQNNKLMASKLFTESELRFLFVTKYSDSRHIILSHFLNFSLLRSHTNDSSSFSSSNQDETLPLELEGCLSRIVDAFCSSYLEEDSFQLRMFTDFIVFLLKDSKGKTIRIFDSVSVMKQIILVADFSESCNVYLNEHLFSFLRVVLSRQVEDMEIDFLLRVLFLHFENGSHGSRAPPGSLENSTALLRDLLTKCTLEDLESFASILITFLYDSNISSVSLLNSLLSTFSDLSKCTNINGSYILTKVFTKTPVSLVQNFWKTLCVSCCKVPVLLSLNELCNIDSKWFSEYRALCERDDIVAHVLTCFRRNCHGSHLNSILQYFLSIPSLSSKMNCCESFDERAFPSFRPHLSEKLETCLSELMTSSNSFKLEEMECIDVFELYKYRLSTKNNQMETLRKELNVVEKSLEYERKLNVQCENEMKRVSITLESLLEKLLDSNEEIQILRRERERSHREIEDFKDNLSLELKKKNEAMAKIQKDLESSNLKIKTYKESNEALSLAIQEHIIAQEELKSKIQQEKQISSETLAAFERREEKLRRKERQLDEESSLRQKIERDLELLRSENSNLSAYNKRAESALVKKDKQIGELNEEIAAMKHIQDQIFNLSKYRNQKVE